MADKSQFTTIETDPEELNAKIRRHRLKILKVSLIIAGVLLLIAAGIFLFLMLFR